MTIHGNAWPLRSIPHYQNCAARDAGAATTCRNARVAPIYYREQWTGVRRQGARRLGAYLTCVNLSFIRPGKPVENAYINAYIESLNGKFRDECLNEHWFLSLRQAKPLIEDWRVECNTERPHSALRYLTPQQFAQDHQQKSLLTLDSRSAPY